MTVTNQEQCCFHSNLPTERTIYGFGICGMCYQSIEYFIRTTKPSQEDMPVLLPRLYFNWMVHRDGPQEQISILLKAWKGTQP